MPHISQRGQNIAPSPIRKLVPFAEGAKRRGIKVYHLNIGQPDIRTPQVAVDAVRNIHEKVFEYTHSAGRESYRKKLAEYYRRTGIEVGFEEIIVTDGGSEALQMAMTVCMDSGDEIITPEPYYANYNGFAAEAGVAIVPVRSRIDDDFALPPVRSLEEAITPRTKAILLCNPNNPTGYLYNREELDAIARIVERHGLFLICDEVYREFCYDGAVHYSSMNLTGIEQNVVMVDSVSKRYSMCGVRLGCLVTRNREILDGALRMAQARLSPPLLAQIAAEAAVDVPPSYFQEVNTEYLRRRNCLVEALNRIEGVYCPMPKGAFYVTVKLPVDDADKFARWMLEDFSHEGATVMIAPASGFYSNPDAGRDQARLAYVLKNDDLLEAARCLAEGLKLYPGRLRKTAL
ncbi:MAG: pyridoxal phosphate-dependent aminotransferase [Rikenellaceae bacterium]|nr:pyridoxal phosphate-dependent aminotransferase [Rikenellaceae bacterium]